MTPLNRATNTFKTTFYLAPHRILRLRSVVNVRFLSIELSSAASPVFFSSGLKCDKIKCTYLQDMQKVAVIGITKRLY